jgi:predicted RNA binding protein YcfA (HicA-like mRNA interferase family)
MPKVREVERRLRAEGWYEVKGKGSHRNFKHAQKPGKVTLPGHPNDEIPPGTWASIKRQVGWVD